MLRNRIYESMTRLNLSSNRYLRVWCTTTDCDQFGPDAKVVEAINALGQFPAIIDVRIALNKLEHVAAYEITGGDGNGNVTYMDWP